MNQQFSPTDVTSDDRLWAALAYFFSPLVPIIILLMPDKKDRPFIKAHNMQALILGVVEWIINAVLSPVLGLGCITAVIFLALNVYLGIQANNGKVFELPVITNFIRQQGW